jgi:hypothetical protein
LLRLEEAKPAGSHIRAKYFPPGYKSKYDDGSDEDDEGRSFDCVMHLEWPVALHGTVDLDLDVPSKLNRERKGEVILQFADDFDAEDVFLLCEYETVLKWQPTEIAKTTSQFDPKPPFANSVLA